MTIVEVTEKSQFAELENGRNLAVVGFPNDERNLKRLLDMVREMTPLKEDRVYVASGKAMNANYGLEGDRAYPEGAWIACVMERDMEEPSKFIHPHFPLGSVWFSTLAKKPEA